MNPYQIAKQLRYLLVDRQWAGTGGRVFSEVVVTPLTIVEMIENAVSFPICGIRVGTARPNAINPGILDEQEYVVGFAADVPNDPHFMASVIGGGRPDLTLSDERGVIELETEIKAVLERLTGADGIRMTMKPSSGLEVGMLEGGHAIAWKEFTLMGPAQSQPWYHPCRAFTATNAGSGNATLAWKVPPDRWDRHSVILRRASGATPPASATAGTGITLASALATGVTDSPGAGTWSYALFAAYDDNEDGTVDNYSAAITRASVVVA